MRRPPIVPTLLPTLLGACFTVAVSCIDVGNLREPLPSGFGGTGGNVRVGAPSGTGGGALRGQGGSNAGSGGRAGYGGRTSPQGQNESHAGSGGAGGVGGIPPGRQDESDAGSGADPAAVSGSVLLGDFEDGTAKPQDPRFAVYHYYAYNPGMSMTPAGMSMNVSPPPSAFFVGSPLVSPGYNSNHALGLNWQIMDVPDGVLNHPGVALQTDVSTGFVDLSGYDRVVFAQQYRYSGACQPLQMLKVIIRCDELNTDYEASVAVSPTWITSSLSFSKFVEASNKPASGHTFSECLAVTNSVVFQAQVDLADGDCDSGSLALDNIEIRPAAARPESGGDAGASSGADGGDAASSPTDAGL